MTVLDDRIEMADSTANRDELTLDTMFEWLEKGPIPEGYRVEIVGGNIFRTPQRNTHWEIFAAIYDQLRDAPFQGRRNEREGLVAPRGRRVRGRGDLQGHSCQ